MEDAGNNSTCAYEQWGEDVIDFDGLGSVFLHLLLELHYPFVRPDAVSLGHLLGIADRSAKMDSV